MAVRRCVVIPAIKKNAVIPDQLVKRLGGVTLIQRALDTAKATVPAEDVLVVTDSQEISLVCERNGVRFHYNSGLKFTSLDIVRELRGILEEQAARYAEIIIYRASCPLLTADDINHASACFAREDADCMVTVKSVPHRVWESREGRFETLLGDEGAEAAELLVESKALILLKAEALREGRIRRAVPYFLNDRAIEINSYQDWWICERLLARRHVVFVVAGYPAIGMGHVFRGLMLAHEIAHHKITFLCTRESEMAVVNIAARDYKTCIQKSDDLAAEVLALGPDLVINDMLDTSTAYMTALKAAGLAVVNFEDQGPGADQADLVINALYEPRGDDPRFLFGPKYFCLRDEFLTAERNVFRPRLHTVLVTFGGTDEPDFTRQTLELVEPLCRERGIALRVVTGPGYLHRARLEAWLAGVNNPQLVFTSATNVMSRMMEGVDLAISSAGRTVYELAHMRVPSLVMAQHQREATHTFARARNGFVYLGVMQPFRPKKLQTVFTRLVEQTDARQRLFERQNRIRFEDNKQLVVGRILHFLE